MGVGALAWADVCVQGCGAAVFGECVRVLFEEEEWGAGGRGGGGAGEGEVDGGGRDEWGYGEVSRRRRRVSEASEEEVAR